MPKIGALAAVVLAGTVTSGGVAWAGRPLTIDDADPADPGQFELEAGAGYEHVSDCKHWDFPFGLTYGCVPGIEIGAGFGGQLEERTELHEGSDREACIREHSIGDLVVGAKWQFIESCPFGARHAIATSVKFPTSDENKGLGTGETDCDLTWVASKSLGEKAGIHVNLGYSWIGGPDDDVVHYGVALDCVIAEPVQWVGEVFAEKETVSGENAVVQYNTGFRWNPAPRLTVDIAGGSKISGDTPDFTGTVGLTWAFASNSNGSK